jgi:hypothetical protein
MAARQQHAMALPRPTKIETSMTKQTASARGAAKPEARAKQPATAQAKAKKANSVAITSAAEMDRLLGQLKSLVDDACQSFAASMRDAAELAFRLHDEFGLSQFKIGAAIGRSQQWVSAVLIWRSKGYPDTAFGPQAKQARAKPLPVTGKTEPNPNVGMPPGPKVALLSDGTIARVTGNDVDAHAPAQARTAAASEDVPVTMPPEPAPPAPPQPPLTPEEISDDLLSKAKKFWREEIAPGITDEDARKYRLFISDEKQWKSRDRRAA